jgi:hypothetical protein
MIKRATQQGATEQIMDQVELLTAIIEASVALIGFSGLVIALGRRSSGERPIWPIGYYTLVRLVVHEPRGSRSGCPSGK